MDTTTTTTMQHRERGFYFNPDQDRYDNNNVQSLNQETSHFREERRSTKPLKKQTQFAERISTSTNTEPNVQILSRNPHIFGEEEERIQKCREEDSTTR